jgi:hypothetical protein
VLRRAIGLVLVLGLTPGCLVGRVLQGEVPEECRYAAGADLEWAGHGHPGDFGLVPRGAEPASVDGDIFVYVEGPHPDTASTRVFCVLAPSAEDVSTASGSTVPAGWQPP